MEKEHFDTGDLGYRLWYQDYGFKKSDSQLALLLNAKIEACRGGNLRLTRKSLFLSPEEVARKLGISRRSYLQLEKSDALGTIKLKTIVGAAESMDCELIYFLRPKVRILYSRVVWNHLVPEASKNGMYQKAEGARKQRALYGAAKRVFADPAFARAQKWSQRRVRMFYDSE